MKWSIQELINGYKTNFNGGFFRGFRYSITDTFYWLKNGVLPTTWFNGDVNILKDIRFRINLFMENFHKVHGFSPIILNEVLGYDAYFDGEDGEVIDKIADRYFTVAAKISYLISDLLEEVDEQHTRIHDQIDYIKCKEELFKMLFLYLEIFYD